MGWEAYRTNQAGKKIPISILSTVQYSNFFFYSTLPAPYQYWPVV